MMNEGGYIYFQTTPFYRVCSVCGRQTKTLAEIVLHNISYFVCCKEHAEEAMRNFKDNVQKLTGTPSGMEDRSVEEEEIRSTSHEDRI